MSFSGETDPQSWGDDGRDLSPDDFSRGWDADPAEPDAVDLMGDTATMLAVVQAELYTRVDAVREEAMALAAHRGWTHSDVVARGVRLEIAAKLRLTEYAAGVLLQHAEALRHRYPSVLDAMHGARITDQHATTLVDEIDRVDATRPEELVPKALDLAERLPVGRFRRELRKLIDTALAPTLSERHAAAVERRHAVVEPSVDAMAWLHVHLPAVEAHAIFARATAIAKVLLEVEGETRTLDQLRADVIADLLIDGTTDDHPAEARGIRAEVVVTVPALSLLHDRHAKGAEPPSVEGVGPIPIETARELCGGYAEWMRVLTHPETGMVLSVGRDRYRPPPGLRRLVRWRAGRCMAPGCGMPAARCEIDHNIAWAEGGETKFTNLCPFCKGHHLVKHHGGWSIEQVECGAIRWTSPTGRRYTVEPERTVPTFTVVEPAPF